VSQSTSSSLGAAALDYAAAGWRVFPIKPGQKKPPLTRHGFKNATTDRELVRRLWTRFPTANIGVATGNGLAVIDVDRRNGGELRPEWPVTLTARTPSGGVHFFYSVTERVRNSAGRMAQGVDVRGDGGYVLVAPSVVDGVTYEWIDVRPIAEIGVELVLPTGAGPARGRRRGRGGRELPADWRPYEPPELVREGRRHDELTRFAGWLRAHGFDSYEIEEAVLDYNEAACIPSLEEEEVLGIARWAGSLER
jgi:Bifunctional DNA primase/polymerase, N-terminal